MSACPYSARNTAASYEDVDWEKQCFIHCSVTPNERLHHATHDVSKRIILKCADGDVKAALRLLTYEDTISGETARK